MKNNDMNKNTESLDENSAEERRYCGIPARALPMTVSYPTGIFCGVGFLYCSVPLVAVLLAPMFQTIAHMSVDVALNGLGGTSALSSQRYGTFSSNPSASAAQPLLQSTETEAEAASFVNR